MKKFLTLALLLLATPAIAEVTSTFGGQNSDGTYAVTSTQDADGQYFTFGASTAILYPYETHSTGGTNALTAAESGKSITDTVGAKHTLPRAAVGERFTLSTGAKVFATLDTVDTSDTILYSISGTLLDAGDSIKSTGQAGDSVTVQCNAANQWTITGMKATWTDNGGS